MIKSFLYARSQENVHFVINSRTHMQYDSDTITNVVSECCNYVT